MTDVLDQEVVEAKAPDLVRLEDYERAAQVLVAIADGYMAAPDAVVQWKKVDPATHPGAVGRKWLLSAAEHLARKVDQSFRDGPKLVTEQQAMAFVKGLAPHFQEAGKALLEAAEALKAAGKVMPANRAYQAYRRAAAKAQELNP